MIVHSLVTAAYNFTQEPEAVPPWLSVVQHSHPLSAVELGQYSRPYAHGLAFSTVICQGDRYLPWLQRRLEQVRSRDQHTGFRVCAHSVGCRIQRHYLGTLSFPAHMYTTAASSLYYADWLRQILTLRGRHERVKHDVSGPCTGRTTLDCPC